ncbi:DNA-directed RNA polymerase II 19 kDa polypeptide [Lineolata rhizophorae]|uniref:DNA-directed RNA polymerase subunit n=1 Tax=Lineolata rhizophorae TaxID=578093 RepID=A0A6A6P8G8_9PEZI|nr:DNA-directed RNA polymerase II 19 kDa polypeptide [Lineolata rhizophorae]
MFFLHELERTITLHPSFFGPRIDTYIGEKLLQDVEGINTGNYYVVCVLDSFDLSEGRVIPGTGSAEYTVHFRAVVWRPFKGEILDGIVAQVVESGIFVDVGPLSCFVAKSVCLVSELNTTKRDFLTLQKMIPSDIKYDGNSTPPQWTDNADQVIEKGSHIRIKIKGIRVEVDEMFAIATIKEDYLGPLPNE